MRTVPESRVFTTSEALRFAWQSLKGQRAAFLVLGSASVMLTLISQSLGQHGGLGEALLAAATHVLRALVVLVLVRASLRVFDGQPVDLARAAPLISGFGGWLLTALGYVVSLVLVLPAITFFFAPVLAAAGVEPRRAFYLSNALTRGYRWRTLGLVVALLALNALGLLAFGVGLVLTVPMSVLAAVYACRTLQGRAPVQASRAPSPELEGVGQSALR